MGVCQKLGGQPCRINFLRVENVSVALSVGLCSVLGIGGLSVGF